MSKSVLLGPEIGKSVEGAPSTRWTVRQCRWRPAEFIYSALPPRKFNGKQGRWGKKSRKSPSNIICSFYFFYIFLCILTHLFFLC